MVKKVEMKQFSAIDDGSIDWAPLRKNLADIEKKINEFADEIKALSQRQTFTISGMFQTRGKHTLVNSGAHVRCKITNAYAVIHDNIETEVIVSLLDLAEVKFSDSEKKGSGKIFDIPGYKSLHFVDSVEVELSDSRRVSVYVTFESVEVE